MNVKWTAEIEAPQAATMVSEGDDAKGSVRVESLIDYVAAPESSPSRILFPDSQRPSLHHRSEVDVEAEVESQPHSHS